ncbi:MAG: glycosyltransferase family 2 protein [Ktedonobacteraceae bacterium]|nr:glycosyltransferase family 2 protein [Ktedonobacteraceae bacterium]MBV9021220.1 glycosyltransferase family 2 protein [Ktedonobacteraceae bacterium]
MENSDEFTDYLRWLAGRMQVIVVDASPPDVFAVHAVNWSSFTTHIAPDAHLRIANGKVKGVLTGLLRAKYEHLIIADDDVRYDLSALIRMIGLLDSFHAVRPQNYFAPLPWHALWDTGRTLLNRMTGGDWPGTLGVRRSMLQATDGYDGDVLFENLELTRTVQAAGGVEAVPLDLFVHRYPPSSHHFWSQRIRQAYDELARPWRFVILLTLLPMTLTLALYRHWISLVVGVLAIIGLAELGRRRGNGAAVFPFAASLFAPIWLAERAICIWLALAARLFLKGIPYRGSLLTRAATPMSKLRQRHKVAQTLLLQR